MKSLLDFFPGGIFRDTEYPVQIFLYRKTLPCTNKIAKETTLSKSKTLPKSQSQKKKYKNPSKPVA